MVTLLAGLIHFYKIALTSDSLGSPKAKNHCLSGFLKTGLGVKVTLLHSKSLAGLHNKYLLFCPAPCPFWAVSNLKLPARQQHSDKQKLETQLASDNLLRPPTRVRHFGSLRRADIPKRPFLFFLFPFLLRLSVCARGALCVALLLRLRAFPLFTEICSKRLTSDFTTAVFLSFATSNWIFLLFFLFLFFLGRFFCKPVDDRLAGLQFMLLLL
jgi:hypothetical protein